MTAATTASTTTGSKSRPASTSRTWPLERDVMATLALAAYSLSVAFGFARVFSGWEFLPDLVALIVVGHGLSFTLRRNSVRGWLAIAAVAAAEVWTVLMLRHRTTTEWLLPSADTWHQLRLEIDLVGDQFQTAVAPVIYEVGWATLACVAIALVVTMSDAFAFRAEARGEALVPGGVAFIFIAALGSPRVRVMSTMVLVAAGVLAVVALRHLYDRTRRIELMTGRRGSYMVPAVLATAAGIAVLAGVIGPRLPGAASEPWYETRGRGGGVTQITSPLVDIRSRLVNQGNVELFKVNATASAYWRVTTLPEFDGQTFKLPRRPLSDVDDLPSAPGGRPIRQQIQILALQPPFIPAAADPVAVSPQGVQANVDTASLYMDEFGPGDVFIIDSIQPDLRADTLRATSSANPPDEMFLSLPDDLPGVVAEIAAEVTADADTDYDKVLALQNYFQTFDYSTDVQSGHGSNAIEAFLDIKTGYCEQFAATMAAMTRTLDIPSRVAVGYTAGLPKDGWLSVLGKNAHAWPEIWFEGVGWVAFEPTPGRGIPGARSYTGLDEAQETEGQVFTPDAVAPDTVPPTPTTIVRSPVTTVARRPGEATSTPSRREDDTSSTPTSDESSFPWIPAALGVLVVAGAVFPALARLWQERRTRAHTYPQRVEAAWARARRSAARAGVTPHPSMTSAEWAAATADQLPVAARPMASLAAAVDRVRYARPFDDEQVRGAQAHGARGQAGARGTAQVTAQVAPHVAPDAGPDVDTGRAIGLNRELGGEVGEELGAEPGVVTVIETAAPSAAVDKLECELWAAQVDRVASDAMSATDRLQQYFRDWR